MGAPNGKDLYVVGYNHYMSVISTGARRVTGTVIVECHPAYVTVSPDNRDIYVAHDNRRPGDLSVITHS